MRMAVGNIMRVSRSDGWGYRQTITLNGHEIRGSEILIIYSDDDPGLKEGDVLINQSSEDSLYRIISEICSFYLVLHILREKDAKDWSLKGLGEIIIEGENRKVIILEKR